MPSVRAVVALLREIRARRREQWLSTAELHALRAHRLRRLAVAAASTRYWPGVFAQAGLSPASLDEDALQRLPLLDKATVQDRTPDLLTRPRTQLFVVRTSGSSGRPAEFFRTERDQSEVSALHGRIAEAFGRRTLDRQVSIGSGVPTASKGPMTLLRRVGVLPQIRRLSSLEPLVAQVAEVRALQPDIINGYSVAVELLAEAVVAAGITDIRPRLVYTGSMPTSERCRTLSAQAFGVRPLDVYAITEAGPVAFECPASPEDYHLSDDVQLVEIVDERGRRLPDGETGEVVVTPLTLLGEPLLRYRVGDLAARRPYRCRCGRGLALMGPVEGRVRHVIRTPDGRTLNQAGIGPSFRKEHGVRRWQVRHTAPDSLLILVVTESPWSAEGRAQTVNLLGSRLGDAMRIELREVEDIPVTSGGKFQAIIPLAEDATPRQR
jgi:phenylacetate-coenzyme A ligase PaaK-like adenylate-forming protein